MAEQRNVRTNLYFLAVVLIGALAATTCFAKPAHWRTHSAGHHKMQPAVSVVPSHNDRAEGKGQSGNQQGPKARIESKPAQGDVPDTNQPVGILRGPRHDAKGAPAQNGNAHETSNGPPANSPNVPEFHMRDLGPVETRIAVPPRGDTDRMHRQQQAKAKFRLNVSGNGHDNQNHARKAPDVARNAIGIPVAPLHDGHRNDAPSNLHVAMGDHGAPPSTVVKSGIAVRTNANQEPVRLGVIRSNSNPVTSPAFINRGAINGSGMPRHGFAPAAVGGPPRTIAGINGTMFRPKR